MLSKKQITGAWRKGRIHIRLKQLSKMLGIKCGQVFLDADHYGFWLSTTSFTMAFCCVISEITSQSPCSWGWFVLKCESELCWKWRRIFLVDQRQISWCVFFNRHISHHLAFVFSHENVNDFCFYSQLRWDSLRTYRCVVANNSTNGSPYCCGRTSTEWAIFGSPSMETIATICWDVSKLICLPAPFVI